MLYSQSTHITGTQAYVCTHSHCPYHAFINCNKHTIKTNNFNDLWLIQHKSCQIILILHLHFTNGNRQWAELVLLTKFTIVPYQKRGGLKITLKKLITITVSISKKTVCHFNTNQLNNK